MSFWATAIVAAKQRGDARRPRRCVGRPSRRRTASTGLTRTIRYTPAVTIVAAWISADTGVGPAMASGSQMYSGSCADLPTAPTNSSSGDRGGGGRRQQARLGAVVEHAVAERADRREGEEHRHHEAPVTDAVGDEGLLAGGGGRLAGVPEGDQEVGAGADALPAEERDQQVLAEHQQQHGEDEQVQVEEELRELRVAVHVPDRVQVDQRADAGDEQAHR